MPTAPPLITLEPSVIARDTMALARRMVTGIGTSGAWRKADPAAAVVEIATILAVFVTHPASHWSVTCGTVSSKTSTDDRGAMHARARHVEIDLPVDPQERLRLLGAATEEIIALIHQQAKSSISKRWVLWERHAVAWPPGTPSGWATTITPAPAIIAEAVRIAADEVELAAVLTRLWDQPIPAHPPLRKH